MTTVNVKAIRDALELTQEQMGRRLGVSFVTVNRWERSVAKPSPLAREKLDKLAHQLHLDAT